jgi:uncharacterized protein
MNLPAVPEEQRRLLALQELDTETARLRRRAADLPEQREADRTAQELREVAGQLTALLDALGALRASDADEPVRTRRLEAQLAEVKGRGGHLAARHRAAVADVPRAAAAVEAAIAEGVARRAGLVREVDPALLAAYESARRRAGDPVVVPVSAKGSCGGCHLTIPALQLDRIREVAGTTLSRCPECERYLVIGLDQP